MNREIKFRAWDLKNNQMLDWGTLTQSAWNNNMAQLLYSVMASLKPNYILQQFTGLHDKNGKEIYEGDILISSYVDGLPTQLCFGEFTCDTYETKDLATQIGFYWHELDGTKSIFGKSVDGNMDYCEVIGNIYETPELLNKQS